MGLKQIAFSAMLTISSVSQANTDEGKYDVCEIYFQLQEDARKALNECLNVNPKSCKAEKDASDERRRALFDCSNERDGSL